ncbi:pleckstrin homology domain-containing family B member 2 isoform 4-T6 [Amazona ochrocephala]
MYDCEILTTAFLPLIFLFCPLDSATMAFVKSGWLLRQSTILRRWKKNWFDLWSDGRLIFYDDQNRHDIEDKIHMRIHCINLRVGNECRDFQPPEGKQRDCLLQIVCRDGKTVNLCAESADDCLAWKIALQDARTNPMFAGWCHMTVQSSLSQNRIQMYCWTLSQAVEIHASSNGDFKCASSNP